MREDCICCTCVCVRVRACVCGSSPFETAYFWPDILLCWQLRNTSDLSVTVIHFCVLENDCVLLLLIIQPLSL